MFGDMIAYFSTPENWVGNQGILARLQEHLGYSLLAVAIAGLIAVPIGLYIGHTGRGSVFAVGLANVLRALPSLGLMTLLVLTMGLGLFPPVIALVVLAIPPILAGVYAGVQNVDRNTVDASRAMGMRERQIVLGVEIPIAMPLIIGGFRSATLQVIATATIAAYVNLGGIGRYIFDGLAVYDYGRVLVGAVLVTALAIVVDGVLAWIEGRVGPARRAIRTPVLASRGERLGTETVAVAVSR